MAGANVAMLTSALLKYGIDHLRTIRAEIETWMDEHGYPALQVMRGSMSMSRVGDPSAYERANYMRVLRSYSLRSPAP